MDCQLSASIDYPIFAGGMPQVAKRRKCSAKPAASIVVMVNGDSETDDNLGNGNRQCAAASPSVWVLHMCDTPVIEMIAKPALPLWGLVIRTDKRSAKYCSERSSIDAFTGVDLTAHCNGSMQKLHIFDPFQIFDFNQSVKSKKSMRTCFE
jgi:hypothetical protein